MPHKIINPVFMRVYKHCRRVQIPLSAPFLNRHNRAIPHGYGGFCIFHTLTILNKIHQKYIIFNPVKQKLVTELATFYIIFLLYKSKNRTRRDRVASPVLLFYRAGYNPPVAPVELDILVLAFRVLRAGVDAHDALRSGGQNSEIVGPVPRGAAHTGVI